MVAGAGTVVAWNVCPAWHVTQPDVMPVWLIVQVAKPPAEVLVWHVTQVDTDSGIWLAGLPFTATEPNVASPDGKWQLSQAVVFPFAVCCAACIVQLGAAKPPIAPEGGRVLLWHVSHAIEVAIWNDGLLTTPGYVPAWQVAQPVEIPA